MVGPLLILRWDGSGIGDDGVQRGDDVTSVGFNAADEIAGRYLSGIKEGYCRRGDSVTLIFHHDNKSVFIKLSLYLVRNLIMHIFKKRDAVQLNYRKVPHRIYFMTGTFISLRT